MVLVVTHECYQKLFVFISSQAAVKFSSNFITSLSVRKEFNRLQTEDLVKSDVLILIKFAASTCVSLIKLLFACCLMNEWKGFLPTPI